MDLSGGRSADPQAGNSFGPPPQAGRVTLHRPSVSAKLLPQAHRDCILQVGPPRFDHVIELNGLVAQFGNQADDLTGQFVQSPQCAQADGGGDGIVGALGRDL